jgi:hypothetical protein
LAKRLHITNSPDYQWVIIGIASEERIWKVCYAINQQLGLRLKERRTEAPEKPAEAPLFEQDSAAFPPSAAAYYEDMETFSRHEYVLLPAKRRNLPPEARGFSFLLLIHADTSELPAPAAVIEKLLRAEIIRSAVDLSQVNNIKHILP